MAGQNVIPGGRVVTSAGRKTGVASDPECCCCACAEPARMDCAGICAGAPPTTWLVTLNSTTHACFNTCILVSTIIVGNATLAVRVQCADDGGTSTTCLEGPYCLEANPFGNCGWLNTTDTSFLISFSTIICTGLPGVQSMGVIVDLRRTATLWTLNIYATNTDGVNCVQRVNFFSGTVAATDTEICCKPSFEITNALSTTCSAVLAASTDPTCAGSIGGGDLTVNASIQGSATITRCCEVDI